MAFFKIKILFSAVNKRGAFQENKLKSSFELIYHKSLKNSIFLPEKILYSENDPLESGRNGFEGVGFTFHFPLKEFPDAAGKFIVWIFDTDPADPRQRGPGAASDIKYLHIA